MAVDRRISITATFLSLKSKIYTKIFNGGKFEYGRRKIRTNSNIHEKKIDKNSDWPQCKITINCINTIFLPKIETYENFRWR